MQDRDYLGCVSWAHAGGQPCWNIFYKWKSFYGMTWCESKHVTKPNQHDMRWPWHDATMTRQWPWPDHDHDSDLAKHTKTLHEVTWDMNVVARGFSNATETFWTSSWELLRSTAEAWPLTCCISAHEPNAAHMNAGLDNWSWHPICACYIPCVHVSLGIQEPFTATSIATIIANFMTKGIVMQLYKHREGLATAESSSGSAHECDWFKGSGKGKNEAADVLWECSGSNFTRRYSIASDLL